MTILAIPFQLQGRFIQYYQFSRTYSGGKGGPGGKI